MSGENGERLSCKNHRVIIKDKTILIDKCKGSYQRYSAVLTNPRVRKAHWDIRRIQRQVSSRKTRGQLLCFQSLPFPGCYSPANRRQLPESVQSEVKWQWWCPLPELQEAGSTRISLPLWACTQRHPSPLQKQQKKTQGLWVGLSSWGSGRRGGQKQHLCACTRWHSNKTLQCRF